MNDFEVDMKELSVPARMTLQTVDSYLTIMEHNNPEFQITELDLHHLRWDELETSLKWNTRSGDDYSSLKTHTYRGVKIVRKEWEQ